MTFLHHPLDCCIRNARSIIIVNHSHLQSTYDPCRKKWGACRGPGLYHIISVTCLHPNSLRPDWLISGYAISAASRTLIWTKTPICYRLVETGPSNKWAITVKRLSFDHWTLQWRHNERDGVSNHQPRDCLLNRLFSRRSKKTSKVRVTGLCAENSPVSGEFPAHKGPVTRKMFPFDDVIRSKKVKWLNPCGSRVTTGAPLAPGDWDPCQVRSSQGCLDRS